VEDLDESVSHFLCFPYDRRPIACFAGFNFPEPRTIACSHVSGLRFIFCAMNDRPLVGCAGWSIPVPLQARFAAAGTHLERYAAGLPSVEINSSFYRPHLPATYARWAASVPPTFQFSVKVPRSITHERRLKDIEALLEAFLRGTADRNLPFFAHSRGKLRKLKG
jgi:hypothetical protein